MKFVKKLIVFILISAAGHLSAQKFRIEGGYINSVRFSPDSTASGTHFNGIRIGATYELNLKHNFSLLTGALYNVVYSNKIQKYSSSDSVIYTTFGHSIDVPIRLTYTYPVTSDLKVFGFAGPNINIGLAQPQKIVSNLSTALQSLTGITPGMTDLYKNALISRINFQMGVGAGVQWKKYQLKAGYDFGINSLSKVDTSNFHQSGWYVSFSYEF